MKNAVDLFSKSIFVCANNKTSEKECWTKQKDVPELNSELAYGDLILKLYSIELITEVENPDKYCELKFKVL